MRSSHRKDAALIMIFLCYLAAGSAVRFGKNKLLADFHGKPLFRYGLSLLTEIVRERKDCRLLVISRYSEILKAAEECGAEAIFCPESENGLSYTVRCAAAHCLPLTPSDRILFMAADQPFASEETVNRILSAAPLLSETVLGTAPLAACAAYGEEEGNPVMFSA